MSPIKRFFLMLALTSMWSPSFLFIKMAVQDLPPMTIVSLRVTLAALFLLPILAWKRLSLPSERGFWIHTAMMAFLASVLPFCLFCYAEQSIDSALAAILNGTTPMFTAVLAQIFVPSDKMNKQKILGVGLSCFGLVLLFAPKLLSGVSGTTLGMSVALFAAFCYAVSHVYAKLFLTGQKPYIAPAAQFIASSLMITPFAIYCDKVWTLSMPSTGAVAGVLGLALFGTVFAFIIYFRLMEHCGPTALSTVSCFFPVCGMLLGFIFLGETFSAFSWVAAAVILSGMVLVNEAVTLKFLRPKEEWAQE